MLGTLVVVLPAFWTMGQIGRWRAIPLAAIVVAVMLGLSLPRAVAAISTSDWPPAAAALLVVTFIATVASAWVAANGWPRIAGATVYSLVAGFAVWLRRYGRVWRAVALFAQLPLIAVLVAPIPSSLTGNLLLWVVVSAITALTWAGATAYLMNRPDPGERPGGNGPRRLQASTRMSVQLIIAVAVAFGAGQVVDEKHIVWPVLTALIVLNNNRGREDVLRKGAQRLTGALAGTAAATVLVSLWPPGDTRSVVAIFVVIAVAAAVRPFGYVYWAACVTAGLSFLYGYLGEGGMDTLTRRLAGIAVGGVIAVLTAWFVAPVKPTGSDSRRA